jgi:hypothetical protein
MTTETKLMYSNPRKEVTIENWPSGGQIVTANFSVEVNKKGERGVRQTTGKPKKLTYARKVVFADGSDGRLYVLELGCYNNAISVMRGTFDHSQEYITETDERHADLMKFFLD